MLGIADDASLPILVERGVARRLAEGDLGRDPAGAGAKKLAGRAARRSLDVVARQRMLERLGVNHAHVPVEEARPVELAKNAHDPAGPMHVLDVNVRNRRRDLAQNRRAARQPIDVGHGERDFGLVRGGEQVQHGVGRAAHRDVEGHRVFERAETGDRSRQHARVVLLVVSAREVDDEMSGFDEQTPAVGVRRNHRAVPGKRKPERLCQAVHRICSEHARTGAACRAGGALDHRDVGVAHLLVRRRHHRVDEVDLASSCREFDLAGLHRAARNEYCGDVEPQRGHQHAGRDLVAVRDADQGVSAMRVDHVFDAVGDHFARRQRVKHAVVSHRDAVVDGDGVELLGDAPRRLDLARHQLAKVLEVDVAGDELGEGIGDGDDRLAEIAVLHPGRAPEAARASHVAAMRRGAGAIRGHMRPAGR